MAGNPRLLLGKAPDGKQVLRITKSGHSVMESDPMTQPGRFSFASDWNRIDRILQSGVVGANFGEGTSANSFFYMGAPKYARPMITIHQRSGGAGSTYYDSRWAKLPSGGTDDYTSAFWIYYTTANYLVIGPGRAGVSRAFDGTAYFAYTIWDLPG